MNDQAAIEEERPAAQTPEQPSVEQLVPPEQLEKVGLKRSAELIPVGTHGAEPMNMAQQIDLAQYMAKGNAGVPEHLRGNVADCLAIIQMADAVGLHPFLLAQKAYVQKGRLHFESQAFHAMLIQSGKLAKALRAKWDGEGDEMTCTVWGTLKGETEPHYLTSEPLGKLRPARNNEGVVKGSPLWDKKPKVQIYYDTTRDWTRMYCPTACLGMYALEEMEETPIRPMRDVTPTGLAGRLQAVPRPQSEEGHRDGHADRELDKIAPAAKGRQKIKPAETGHGQDVQPVQQAKAGSGPEAVPGVPQREHAGVEADARGERDTEAKGERARVREGVQAEGSPDTGAVRDMRVGEGVDAPSGLSQATEGKVVLPEAPSDGAQNVSHETLSGSLKFKIDADATVLKASPADWQAYRTQWLERIKTNTDPDIIKAWKAERPLREKLSMPVEAIDEVRAMVDAATTRVRKK